MWRKEWSSVCLANIVTQTSITNFIYKNPGRIPKNSNSYLNLNKAIFFGGGGGSIYQLISLINYLFELL